MKKLNSLNQNSAQVFSTLIAKMQDREAAIIKAEGFMNLQIIRLRRELETSIGKVSVYSFSHRYTENGDSMSDPEVTFIHQDFRTDKSTDWSLLKIYPVTYVQHNLGQFKRAIDLTADLVYPSMYADLSQFANQWFSNLKIQGFTSKHAEVILR